MNYFYDPENGINRLIFLGVPEYMFKQNYDGLIKSNSFKASDGSSNISVPKSMLIDFSEETYNQLLNEEIQKRAKDAANKVLNRYGKKVNTLTVTDM